VIRNWLSFFTARRLPRLSELPLLLLRVSSFGAAVGVALTAIFAIGSGRAISLDRLGVSVLYSAAMGVIFSISFYITCGLPPLVIQPLLHDQPQRVRRLLTGLMGAINGAMGFVLAAWAIATIMRVPIAGQQYYGIIVLIDAILGAIISTVIAVVIQAREQKGRAERELLQARFSALQAQINPHFLFNTLNSISALVTRQPEAAQEMIGRLADMFRYALDSQSSLVTLDRELEFVRHYLALEQIRFGDRLSVVLPSREFHGVRLPSLSLQPLVENAVRYGVAQRIEGGIVEVQVEHQDGQCRVIVRNQFDSSVTPNLSPARLFREGHALSNIRERLRIHWNGRSGLRVEQEDAEWVRTVIEFPVES